MFVVFPPIFVVDTKIIYGCNFVAPIITTKTIFKFRINLLLLNYDLTYRFFRQKIAQQKVHYHYLRILCDLMIK